MRKLFTLLFASIIFVACNNTNKPTTKPVEGKVTTTPAKFTLTVINNTDSDMKWEQSWAMTGPDSGVVAAGDTVELSSNEVDSDRINVYPVPPKSIAKPNPASGNFGMQYGWDGHIARIYCDNVCNAGRPTPTVQDPGTNWVYVTKWLKDPSVQTNTTNTVTFTTEAWPVIEE